MSRYHFIGNCVSLDAESIDDMTSHPSETEIDIDECRALMGEDGFNEMSALLGFATGDEPGISIENEPCISFHTSQFRGMDCIDVCFSGWDNVFSVID